MALRRAALTLLLLLVGCATVRTEGTTGPIAWRATDLAVVPRNIEGRMADTYSFTLRLKNTSDRPLTLTTMSRTLYGAGLAGGASSTTQGRWLIAPNAELAFPLYSYTVCQFSSGCGSTGVSTPMWNIVLTGTDDKDRALRILIELSLPAEPAAVLDRSVRAAPPSPLQTEISPSRPPIAPPAPQPARPEPGTSSPAASSQQPVDLRRVSAPVWRPGDEWEYRWESPQGKGTYVWSFAREETVDGTEFYVIATGTREIYWRKHDIAYYMDRIPSGVETRHTPIPAVPWPLSPGTTWQWAFTRESPIARRTHEETLNCTVSEDVVTVPAGTFKTLKITCRDTKTGRAGENWYSPMVKQRVKETRVFDYGTRVRELIGYRVK